MSFPRYPDYKDSGVEWLGEVPVGWEVLKGALIGTLFGSEQVPEDAVLDEGDLPFIKVGSLSRDSFEIESWDYFVDRSVAENYRPRSGYIVFPKRGAAIFTNKVNIVDRPSLIDPNLMGWKIGERAVTAFIAYALKCRKLDELADVSTVPQINNKHIAPERFAIPPIEEQTQIAAFLDRETAKIDELVREQRRLMELLKEKRQAVISHAVTQGLNPHAPMKPSGIEWLGEVPEHWEVKPLKSVCELFGRIGYRGYTTADIVDEGEGAITLSPSNMADGVVSVEKSTYISWEKYSESPEIMIHPGDIVMVKTGSTFGKVAYVSEVSHPTTINPQLVLYKNISCDSRFLFFILNAEHIRALINVNNTGSSIPTMTQEAIGNFRFGLPPEEEQGLIVEFIDSELVKLDTLTAEAQRAIDLLQERRTAMISAAVTGQIDVRPFVEREAA